MTTMLEKMARALCATGFDGYEPDELEGHRDPPDTEAFEAEVAEGWRPGEECWYDSEGDRTWYWRKWRLYAPAARAALLAIREPNDLMIDAGLNETGRVVPAVAGWMAMIDAILNEPAGSTRTRSISEVSRADLVAHIPKSIAPEPPQTGARTRVAEGAATWEYIIRSVTDEGDCWRIEGEPEKPA